MTPYISNLFEVYALFRAAIPKRPWANSTKKGPGRKHQQGKPTTKQEREELK